MEKVQFLNTFVNNCTMSECVEEIENLIESGKKSYVVAVNVDVIIKIEDDEELKRATDNADIVIVDGKPLIWIAKKHKIPVTEKISGSDLVPELCAVAAKKGYGIFILGGRKGVAAKAKANLEKKYEGIKVVGAYEPPLGFDSDPEELDRINAMISAAKPHILLTCFGCPKQEKFIMNNIDKYDATVSVCAGATVDFLAGRLRRAPRWMSNHGLEWLYRFFMEPTRLFKRYFIDDMRIFKVSRKYRKKK